MLLVKKEPTDNAHHEGHEGRVCDRAEPETHRLAAQGVRRGKKKKKKKTTATSDNSPCAYRKRPALSWTLTHVQRIPPC